MVRCPICRSWASSEQCGQCGWRIRTPLILGPATPDLHRNFRSQLERAQARHDIRAALRAAGAPGEEDGQLLQELLDRAVRGASASEETVESCRTRLRGERVPRWPLKDVLSQMLGHVIRGEISGLLVVGLGADRVAARKIKAGRHGTPLEVDGPDWSRTWEEIGTGLPPDRTICRFVLAGGVGDQPDGALDAASHADALYAQLDSAYAITSGRVALALVLERPGWPLLDRVARELARHRQPVAALHGEDFDKAVQQLIDRSPLREPYALVLGQIDADQGTASLVTRTLFEAGTVPGKDVQKALTVQAPEAISAGVCLPVVRFTSGSPETWELVGSGLLPLGPGESAGLWAVLDGVDRVRLVGQTKEVQPDRRSWSELYTSFSVWTRRRRTVDLVFLLELNTAEDRISLDRRGLVREVITKASRALAARDLLRVGLVGYRDHGIRRLYRTEPVVDIVPLGRPDEARARLDDWDNGPPHPTTAALSDALHAASEIPWRDGSARFVLTLGDRMPCGTDQFSKLTPEICPGRRSWKRGLEQVKRDGARCLAVVSRERRIKGDRSWEAIGENGRFDADRVTADDLLEALGLAGDFPFAQIAAGEEGAP
ncbi:hypothetical protein AB0K16_34260 [Nonomuraea jabiensis]|uniref:hypothetical protein n=1 Tax=Nonomuraea jabiensis TaxID=882448 RepID=UPI00341FAA7E